MTENVRRKIDTVSDKAKTPVDKAENARHGAAAKIGENLQGATAKAADKQRTAAAKKPGA